MPASLQGAFPSFDSEADRPRAVLRGFGRPWNAPDVAIAPVAAGFSGGRVWIVDAGASAAALHQWPHGYPPNRLGAIHAILLVANEAGCDFVPTPIADTNGATTIVDHGRLWDLASWMPGEPIETGDPGDARVRAALACLRRWHDAGRRRAAELDLRHLTDRLTARAFRRGDPSPSPGLRRRWSEWQRLRALSPSRRPHADPLHLADRTLQAADRAAGRMDSLESIIDKSFPLVVCWNDPHRDNVLFVGDGVGGLVDYGSVGIDSPAADLGRLLGSFVPNETARWAPILEAYESANAQDWACEARVFFATSAVISALHWWEWHVHQGRLFADPIAAYERWRGVVETLEASLSTGQFLSD